MTLPRRITLLLGWLLCLLPLSAQPAATVRERLPFDSDWRFAFGHPSDPAKDFNHATGYFSYLTKTGYGDGAAAANFDDRGWRQLNLPHDWGVEMPFSGQAGHSHGYKAFGPRFPETSVGWYRKTFTLPAADQGRRLRLVFDGVFRASRVWVNGFYLGEEPSGYLGFGYDITDYANFGGENVVAVRVDVSMEEGWFYEGAGIYRHTWLEKTSPVHVAPDGTFVRTEVRDASAEIAATATIENSGREPASFIVEQQILAPDGQVLATTTSATRTLAPQTACDIDTRLDVKTPRLWSLEDPALHTLVTLVRTGQTIVDRHETRFGIRTLRFDPDRGFFLNNKHVLLKGTNNHQDHAGVGVALPDGLQDFRIRQLLAMGSNAYRCSHNPPTPEFLDACDRLGMLVIDETRLMGSNPLHLDALARMIRRDRNHPSVILWSVGNEEWAIEGNEKGARIAATMQTHARQLDPTRRITAAVSGGWGQGISTVIDVMGYNYIDHGNTDEQHAKFPHQPGVGTEETTTQGTRGVYFDDLALAHSAPVKNGTSGGNAERGWKYYAERPYLAGLFYWTGFDYRGEPNPFGFPAVSSQFGILDTCGFPKDSFYYLQSWWTDKPVLHIYPHWNWSGREGQEITVAVNSNADEVELFLNGESLGKKAVVKNDHLEWTVAYRPGTLLARSYKAGKLVRETKRETTGAPAALTLAPHQTTLTANGTDVAVIAVGAADAQGRAVPDAGHTVTFTLSGPGRIIGVGNGDPSSHEPDQFLPGLTLIDAAGWREKLTTGSDLDALLAPGLACDDWPAAFARDTKARTTPESKLVYRATLDVPALPVDSTLKLLLGAFGETQTVYLDGQRVAEGTSAALTLVDLKPEQLVPGRHQLAVVATPFARADIYENLALKKLAIVRIDSPAPAWQRKLFNGLAQIIVQTTDDSGQIVLRAESAGLAAATVTLIAKPKL